MREPALAGVPRSMDFNVGTAPSGEDNPADEFASALHTNRSPDGVCVSRGAFKDELADSFLRIEDDPR